MKSCWSLDPAKRPSFAELLASLEEELKTKDVRGSLKTEVDNHLYG